MTGRLCIFYHKLPPNKTHLKVITSRFKSHLKGYFKAAVTEKTKTQKEAQQQQVNMVLNNLEFTNALTPPPAPTTATTTILLLQQAVLNPLAFVAATTAADFAVAAIIISACLSTHR
uniref:Uncharacterized protein n=1 Tax=Glossina pallidipes TaxID=7398 RepID=A0A1A9ZAI4_GLOPL